ncbi:MAG: hypothetical protein DDT37_00854 [Firmicutes bacterium]|nr:hypothetical protein [candidate division NPL-UPA2 bacterium]
MPKILVAYFSLTGSTRLIGKAVAKELGADIEEIVPVRHYPLRGLWLYLYGGMQAVLGATPRLERTIVNAHDYDIVIVGTPVWAGRMAPPVRSFLNSLALEGKKVAYFSTFQGSEGQSSKEMVDAGKGISLGEKGFKMTRKSTYDSVTAARQWAKELDLRH